MLLSESENSYSSAVPTIEEIIKPPHQEGFGALSRHMAAGESLCSSRSAAVLNQQSMSLIAMAQTNDCTLRQYSL